jgi:hypothetical protein
MPHLPLPRAQRRHCLPASSHRYHDWNAATPDLRPSAADGALLEDCCLTGCGANATAHHERMPSRVRDGCDLLPLPLLTSCLLCNRLRCATPGLPALYLFQVFNQVHLP